MWMLMRRELAMMNRLWDNDQTHGRLILGLIRYWLTFSLIIFLPGFLFEKYLDTPLESTVAIIVMVFTLVTVQNNLMADDEQRQTVFLQTLPIRKSQIVHAKMTSIFFLWSFNFVLFLLPVAVIQMYRPGTDDLWPQFGFFMSLSLFLISVTTMCYFFWGFRREWLVFFLSILVWVAIAAPVGFVLNWAGNESQGMLFIFPLAFSLCTFLICWWVAVRRMNGKGFAYEGNGANRIDRTGREDEG